jgi:hypothetical protein
VRSTVDQARFVPAHRDAGAGTSTRAAFHPEPASARPADLVMLAAKPGDPGAHASHSSAHLSSPFERSGRNLLIDYKQARRPWAFGRRGGPRREIFHGCTQCGRGSPCHRRHLDRDRLSTVRRSVHCQIWRNVRRRPTSVPQHGDYFRLAAQHDAGALPNTLPVSGILIAAVFRRQRRGNRLSDQIWQLRRGDRIVICEVRRDTGVGSGWDVHLLEDGEVLFSKRCTREDDARFYAECLRQDHVRTGFTE